MGAKIALKAFYTNYERLKYGRSRLFNCTAEFARKHFGLQEDPDKEDDDGDNDDDDDEEEDNEVKNTMPKMEEKRCPDIDPLDDQRIAVTTYGAGPGTLVGPTCVQNVQWSPRKCPANPTERRNWSVPENREMRDHCLSRMATLSRPAEANFVCNYAATTVLEEEEHSCCIDLEVN